MENSRVFGVPVRVPNGIDKGSGCTLLGFRVVGLGVSGF